MILAVVCSKIGTARWARKQIEIGLQPDLVCQVTRVVVFGPDKVPAITDPDEAAADLMLTVFSAFTHSRGPKAGGILKALNTVLATIDEEPAANLVEFITTGLGGTPGAQIWSDIMDTSTFPIVSRPRLKGRAEAVIENLDNRGIDVDDDSRERILSCTDADVVKTWMRRSLTVQSVTELFDE